MQCLSHNFTMSISTEKHEVMDMRMTPVYNLSLLRAIHELNDCTLSDLKQHYLPPEQPGVVQGITVSFDSDLQTLVSMGCVSVSQDRVRFINWP